MLISDFKIKFMKKSLILILSLAIILGVTWIILKQENIKKENDPTKSQVIVAFGDSLVKGYGATEGQDFVSLLSKDIGAPIINLGKNGDTTSDAISRLNEVLDYKPDIVLILLGGNDILRSKPVPITEKNLNTIIETFKKNNTKVLLLGVRGGILKDAYAPMFERIVKDQRVSFVPDILRGVFGKKDLMSDLIHPNDKGYELIRERVAPALRMVINL
jgi:lysophospholipase L1-like esterase